jgi:hypothetical protein
MESGVVAVCLPLDAVVDPLWCLRAQAVELLDVPRVPLATENNGYGRMLKTGDGRRTTRSEAAYGFGADDGGSGRWRRRPGHTGFLSSWDWEAMRCGQILVENVLVIVVLLPVLICFGGRRKQRNRMVEVAAAVARCPDRGGVVGFGTSSFAFYRPGGGAEAVQEGEEET